MLLSALSADQTFFWRKLPYQLKCDVRKTTLRISLNRIRMSDIGRLARIATAAAPVHTVKGLLVIKVRLALSVRILNKFRLCLSDQASSLSYGLNETRTKYYNKINIFA